ncbi:hypothetical protein STPH2_4011 [Streptomyces sp. KO7888]|nr:hypothetical protein [Streptomyces sp. KO7888]
MFGDGTVDICVVANMHLFQPSVKRIAGRSPRFCQGFTNFFSPSAVVAKH